MNLNENSVEAPNTVQRLLHAFRVGDAMTARLANWLLEERKQIVDLPIGRFAQDTGVTETTIVRFCKGIGYSGYRELRLALVQSVGIAKGLQLGAGEQKSPESKQRKDDPLPCRSRIPLNSIDYEVSQSASRSRRLLPAHGREGISGRHRRERQRSR
jgi:RpiR-like protein